jgi:hypothetical protein
MPAILLASGNRHALGFLFRRAVIFAKWQTLRCWWRLIKGNSDPRAGTMLKSSA